MKTIVSLLKRVLMLGSKAVPSLVDAYSPVLGSLFTSLLQNIFFAEAKLGAKTGPDKKELALMIAQGAMPAVQVMLNAAGKPIKNPALFAEGVEKIQDGLVDLLNATGDGAKEPAQPA